MRASVYKSPSIWVEDFPDREFHSLMECLVCNNNIYLPACRLPLSAWRTVHGWLSMNSQHFLAVPGMIEARAHTWDDIIHQPVKQEDGNSALGSSQVENDSRMWGYTSELSSNLISMTGGRLPHGYLQPFGMYICPLKQLNFFLLHVT